MRPLASCYPNLAAKFGDLKIKNDNFNVMVSLNAAEQDAAPQLTRENWREAFAAQLKAYKDGGFDRVNPSILKADILTTYPNFNERAIGFKRFSDIMKQLEKGRSSSSSSWTNKKQC